MALTVLGFMCLYWADQGSTIRPVGVSILSFGLAFILGAFWLRMRRPGLVASIGVLIVTAFLAQTQYAPLYFYVLTGERLPFEYMGTWMSLVALVGLPLMIWVFNTFDEEEG